MGESHFFRVINSLKEMENIGKGTRRLSFTTKESNGNRSLHLWIREEINELIKQKDALLKLNFLLRTDLREYF